MTRNIYFCLKETDYNGQHYWPGQAWDEDCHEVPPIGEYWALRPFYEPDVPVDLVAKNCIVTSSSHGRVQWVPQPGRPPRAAPPTPEELEQERADPYGVKARTRNNRQQSEQDQEEDQTIDPPTPAEAIRKSIARQESNRADFEKDHAAYVQK